MITHNAKLGVVLAAAGMLSQAVWAQQKDPRSTAPVNPIPPIVVESTSKAPAADPAAPAPQEGRTPSLSGIEGSSLGGLWSGRSFLVPSLDFNARGETDSLGGGSRAAGTFSGRLAFQHVWGRNTLASDYSGATTFDIHRNNRNDSYHSWQLSFDRNWRRWTMRVSNVLGYSPEGGFGGGLGNTQYNNGAGGFGNSVLTNLNPFLQQNQTVFGRRSARISNTVAGQGTAQLSSRSSLTFSGTYGILRFLDPGFIDNNRYGFTTGYDYALSGRSSIGVSYGGNLFHFQDTGRDNQSHMVHLSYGRQISGKLSVRLSGGPNVSMIHIPGANTVQRTSWSAESTLNYRAALFSIMLNYRHGNTGGAGYFRGAETDDIQATLSRNLTRMWTGSFNLGFARNQSLIALATGAGGQRYLTWRGGVQVSRPMTRQTRLYLQYGLERQTNNVLGCTTGATCAFSGTRHIYGLGINFTFRTIDLE